MFAPTTRRVAENTPEEINLRIRARMQARVMYLAERPDLLPAQLRALDREWDIERVLEAKAATLGFIGVVLAARVHVRLFLLPALVSGFLLQHAVQGWCPPLPLLRRMGYRTSAEIDEERTALRILRGDYAGLPKPDAPGPRERAMQALLAAQNPAEAMP